MEIQASALGYEIDPCFHKYKLAIEVGELRHNDRNSKYETQRHRAIEKSTWFCFYEN